PSYARKRHTPAIGPSGQDPARAHDRPVCGGHLALMRLRLNRTPVSTLLGIILWESVFDMEAQEIAAWESWAHQDDARPLRLPAPALLAVTRRLRSHESGVPTTPEPLAVKYRYLHESLRSRVKFIAAAGAAQGPSGPCRTTSGTPLSRPRCCARLEECWWPSCPCCPTSP